MADLPDGVPPLLGDVSGLFLDPTSVLSADTYIGYGNGAPPSWGLFLDGIPVVEADTVTSFAYKQDWAVADYPVERGGFESYDKVNTPYRAQIQFVAGGSEANREALLDSIAAIADELTLYDAVTPEQVYVGVNVDGYDYRRTSRNGLGLMVVNVNILEIREEGVTDFKNTKEPSGFAASPTGNIQAVPFTGAPFSAGSVM
jgi:hypothetical protein